MMRSDPEMVGTARALSLLLLGGALTACSNAQEPDAYFDAGPRQVIGDGGGVGGRDQPCTVSQECNSTDLICVTEGSGASVSLTCRLICDPDDTTDPCGAGSTCRNLSNSTGACLGGGGLNDPCPCDEGFSCTSISNENLCKISCEFLDAGGDNCPPDAGTCLPFAGASTGACID